MKKITIKLTWKYKRLQQQIGLEQKEKCWRDYHLDLRKNLKSSMALVLKQTCETMKQNQRTKHVHNYSHLIFDKEIRNISWRK